ncbi:MAG: M42 family metallopeptidase [Clostridiales bacterium]|nr:M42 family metallopeptidase [Clostridiales bacterium]
MLTETLQDLCQLPGVSGHEEKVREYIRLRAGKYGDCQTDRLGNLLVYRKGKKRPAVPLMLDAHMDEVGFIITGVTEEGYLRFAPVGGIDPAVVIARRVVLENGIKGVLASKPVHMMAAAERAKMPEMEDFLIDIGAADRAEAEKYVRPGDTAVFDSGYEPFGDGLIRARAIDDRAGCAVLLEMMEEEPEYDMIYTFTVQEEVGLRGAKTAAFGAAPAAAIVLEATTAADLCGVPEESRVCKVGGGAALSFMDRSTLYDPAYYKAALALGNEKGIACQSKTVVAGGNNAGAIHKSGKGIRTLSVSVPCRYLHSPYCVAALSDIQAVAALAKEAALRIASGAWEAAER